MSVGFETRIILAQILTQTFDKCEILDKIIFSHITSYENRKNACLKGY